LIQVKEGDTINIDVTGPGATLALGMMFFASGNKSVASWMEAPATQVLKIFKIIFLCTFQYNFLYFYLA